MIDVRTILFDGFETLDALGPAEVFGRLPQRYRIRCFSQKGGIVTSAQGIQVQTEALAGAGVANADVADKINPQPSATVEPTALAETGVRYVLLVPGGQGTRPLVNDQDFIDHLAVLTENAWRALAVCTGSALLAKTGLLDGLAATTNKRAFNWVASLRPQVGWQRSARWVRSGHIYTSSGISAGMDMALGFIADHDGRDLAVEAAAQMEYIWNSDSTNDPF